MPNFTKNANTSRYFFGNLLDMFFPIKLTVYENSQLLHTLKLIYSFIYGLLLVVIKYTLFEGPLFIAVLLKTDSLSIAPCTLQYFRAVLNITFCCREIMSLPLLCNCLSSKEKKCFLASASFYWNGRNLINLYLILFALAHFATQTIFSGINFFCKLLRKKKAFSFVQCRPLFIAVRVTQDCDSLSFTKAGYRSFICNTKSPSSNCTSF